MAHKPELPSTPAETAYSRMVGAQEQRKLRAQKHAVQGIWFGMGMMGLVGWSVAVPTLLGTALGLWLDQHYSASHSWTLALLVAGLCLGCANVGHWVAKENTAMHVEDDGDD